MVMTSVPRESLSMQDSACCDYFRTSAIFQVPDIYRFVGDIQENLIVILPVISKNNHRLIL